MKASDLRIGNYVIDNGDISKVTPYLISELYESDRFWVKPIELTEDLLVKCGFMFEHNYFKKGELDVNYCLKYYPHLVGYYFYIEYNNGPNEKDIAQYYPISSTYKYLHQLQNLYFALTGEELNVNL